MRLTNNKIAVLAILLMLVSLICSAVIYQKASIRITGKATAQGYVSICINHPPVLNEFASNLTVREGRSFVYDVNATDPNNATQSLTFYDNTSLFNISSETGIINFTAPGSSAGIYNILITVQDNSTCANSNDTQTLVLNITMDNVAPSITSYYPLGNPTITEEQTRLFNISYGDEDGDTLAVYWYLDNSLVSTFNDISNILKSNYTFTGNYTNAGTYNATVFVSDSLLNDSHSWILTVTNVNRVPSFIRTIKNQTWAEDSTLYGLDLDDYSYDPDTEDTLSYSVNYLTNPRSITAAINDENVVTFSQPADWYGAENISFTVTDNHGASNTSNNVTLTVYNVPETNETIGQAASQAPGRTAECIEFWFCTYWSVCYPEGFMERTCADLSDCGTEYYKPEEIKDCKYIPSCFNKIQDGDETEIDCGGSCGLCPSCFDGAMNNDETGIDCGGACLPCPTCFDGVVNGGEVGVDCGGACVLQDCCANGYRDAHLGEIGIDCGGSCKECAVEIEKPAPRTLFIIIILIIAIITAILSITAYFKRESIKLFCSSIIKRSKKGKIPIHEIKTKSRLSSINRLEREMESKGIEEALDAFLQEFRAVLASMFKIKYEFTYDKIISIIKESKLKDAVKSIFIGYIEEISNIAYSRHNVSKEELVLLTKEFRIIIQLAGRSKREEWKKGKCIKEKRGYERNIDRFYAVASKSLFALDNLEIEKTRELYEDSKGMCLQLLPEERKRAEKLLERVGKEIKLFEKKNQRKERKKDMALISLALIVILCLGSIDIFFGGNITGLLVFEESKEKSLVDIKGFNIQEGEHFFYKITGYDIEEEEEGLSFYDDTKLFNIGSNGIVDFTPTKYQLGVHHVTIIIKDSSYNTLFKDVVFNITRSGGIEYITEISEEILQEEQLHDTTDGQLNKPSGETNQTEEDEYEEAPLGSNQTVGETNEEEEAPETTTTPAEETSATEEAEKGINITQELNETEELSQTEGGGEEINITQETNQAIEETINTTQGLNETPETLNLSSDIEQVISEPEGVAEQLSEDFLLKPLDIYVIYVMEFELGSTAKFNLLVENDGTREIEDSYFKILAEDNNGSIIADIQSTPLNIAEKEKKEMTAYWNSENMAVGDYTGKLIIMYEDKSSQYDIRMDITQNEIKTEIIGITGMVTAPSTVIKTQPYTNIPPVLLWMIILIISIDIAGFLLYSRSKKK